MTFSAGAEQKFIDWLESVFRYIFSASDRVSVEELKEIVEKSLGKDKGGIVMTVAEQLFQKGLQQGMQQGVRQGELKKAREDIVNVLEIRFGGISLSLKEKLADIRDQAILADLLRKAVTVASLAEMEELSATIE